MRLVRSKNTKPEIQLRKALWNAGLRGYRLNWSKIQGKPDIAFTKKNVAIFVHGCFWHGCPKCKRPIPKRNYDFWNDKLKRNKRRDKKNMQVLTSMGWKVFVIWECELKKDLFTFVKKIQRKLV